MKYMIQENRFWKEIFARTEEYWCGIQHQDDPEFNAPEHHVDFLPYGDEEEF